MLTFKAPEAAHPAPGPAHLLDCGSEAHFVFLAARVHSDPALDARIAEAADSVQDWSRVIALGEVNRVLPLVYRAIRRCGVNGIPDRTLRSMKAQVAITALRNESALGELAALQRQFSAHGLRVLHYKGATVALRFFGDLGLRTFHDLDFLIDPENIGAVCTALEAAGYTNSDTPAEDERAHHETEQKEYLFQKRGFNVEPHWKFTPRRFEFDIDYRGIWRRAQAVTVESERLQVPSIEDTLVLMMLVGAAGFWKRLQMLADIAAVTQGEDTFDWEVVEAEMKRLRAGTVLRLAALLASSLSGAKVPDRLLDTAWQDATVVSMARQVTRNLADPDACRMNANRLPWGFQRLLWNMRDGWRDRLTYLVRTTTTPTTLHTRRFPLPQALSPAYVVLVPLHDYVLVPLARAVRELLGRQP